jgi:hypothetical protein
MFDVGGVATILPQKSFMPQKAQISLPVGGTG